jgi:hypothetical protein
MAITSVTASVGESLPDGRKWVVEKYYDGAALVHVHEYVLEGPVITTAHLQPVAEARMVYLKSQLAWDEAHRTVTVDAAPALSHQTGLEFLNRLRLMYQASSKEIAGMLATWITKRIDAGHVTAVQLQNAFGLTAGQWATLETKLRNLRTAYEAVQNAAGE